MVRYAATIWQTKFGALFRFAFLRASQLQFIFQQCLNKPLWMKLTEGEHLVQITFHWIYTVKWILSVENQGCTYTSFFFLFVYLNTFSNCRCWYARRSGLWAKTLCFAAAWAATWISHRKTACSGLARGFDPKQHDWEHINNFLNRYKKCLK